MPPCCWPSTTRTGPTKRRCAGSPTWCRASTGRTFRSSRLSRQAVAAIVRKTLGSDADDDVCTLAHRATGGNPFYLQEFLRALERAPASSGSRIALDDVVGAGGLDAVALQLRARLQSLDPAALHLAQ